MGWLKAYSLDLLYGNICQAQVIADMRGCVCVCVWGTGRWSVAIHSLARYLAVGVDVCLLWVLCVVRYRSQRRADHLSRGVLPSDRETTKGEDMTRNRMEAQREKE